MRASQQYEGHHNPKGLRVSEGEWLPILCIISITAESKELFVARLLLHEGSEGQRGGQLVVSSTLLNYIPKHVQNYCSFLELSTMNSEEVPRFTSMGGSGGIREFSSS